MGQSNHWYLFAAFLVGAALWKVGAPIVPVLLGIVVAGIWTYRKSFLR